MSAWIAPGPSEVVALLQSVRTIAIVGVSANPQRASYEVADYLVTESDYEVHLVNPTLDSLFGRPVHASLAEVPIVPDLVDVFRRQPEVLGVADEAIAVGARCLWLQLGLYDEIAAARSSSAGMTVVMDRCLKTEHARFRHRLG